MDLFGHIMFIIIVSAAAAMAGRQAKMITHSLIPGKEPATYLVAIWGVVTFFLYLFYPGMFAPHIDLSALGYPPVGFTMSFTAVLGMLFAVAVMYPIGYHFGIIKVQHIFEFDKETGKPKGVHPIVYYYNRAGDLCIAEQTLLSSIKALLGAHCTLDMQLDKIVRTYPVSVRNRIIRISAPKCVSATREPSVIGTKKIWKYDVIVRHHKIEITDHNLVDHLTFLMRTNAYVKATQIAADLNTKISRVETERTEDHIVAGARTVRDLRDLTMDDELAGEVRQSLQDAKAIEEKVKHEAMVEMLKKMGVTVTAPVEAPSVKDGGDES